MCSRRLLLPPRAASVPSTTKKHCRLWTHWEHKPTREVSEIKITLETQSQFLVSLIPTRPSEELMISSQSCWKRESRQSRTSSGSQTGSKEYSRTIARTKEWWCQSWATADTEEETGLKIISERVSEKLLYNPRSWRELWCPRTKPRNEPKGLSPH